MTLSESRRRNIAARKRRIVDAAMQMIAEQGLDGLTMRALAGEAGVSVPTLYNLIGDKDAICDAAVGRLLDDLDDALSDLDEREPLKLAEAIVTRSIDLVTGEAEAYRAVIAAAYRLSLRDDATLAQGAAARRSAELQARAMRGAMGQGLVRDDLHAALLGRQIFFAWQHALLGWVTGRLDAAGFKAEALYGLYLVLLAASTDAARPAFLRALQRCERRVATASTSSTAPSPGKDRSHASAS